MYVCHTKMCVYVFCYIQVPLKANVKQSLFQNRSNRALFKINRKSIEQSMKVNRESNCKIKRMQYQNSSEPTVTTPCDSIENFQNQAFFEFLKKSSVRLKYFNIR